MQSSLVSFSAIKGVLNRQGTHFENKVSRLGFSKKKCRWTGNSSSLLSFFQKTGFRFGYCLTNSGSLVLNR